VLRGGYYTFKTNYILPFPVPNEIPADIYISVESLVRDILSKKEESIKTDTSLQEKRINDCIYRLYDLSNVEIELIERK
jgi:hypothetical protein